MPTSPTVGPPLPSMLPEQARKTAHGLLSLLSKASVGDLTIVDTVDELAHRIAALDTNQQATLLAFSLEQGLASTVYEIVARSGVPLFTPIIRRHLADWAYLTKRKNAERYGEAVRLHETLRQFSVPHAFTKGIIWQHRHLDRGRLREFNDIDMMVSPKDAPEVQSILTSKGYHFGKKVDRRTGELVDIPRDRNLMYRLKPDHLPHAYKRSEDGTLEYFIVDIAFSFTWHDSDWQVDVPSALKSTQIGKPSRRQKEQTGISVLAAPYSFLFGVLHLFREAWFLQRHKDVRLAQFADCLMLWNDLDSSDRSSLKTLIHEHNLSSPTSWVTNHIDTIFETDITVQLDLAKHLSDDWIASAMGPGSSPLRWHGDMRLRLAGICNFSPKLGKQIFPNGVAN